MSNVHVLLDDVSITMEVVSPVIELEIGTPQLILPITAVVGGSGGGGGSLTMIWGETPTGSINGTNRIFTSSHFYSPSLLAVYLNGLRQRRTDDYTETGNQTFQFVNAPLPGDSLSIDYVQP